MKACATILVVAVVVTLATTVAADEPPSRLPRSTFGVIHVRQVVRKVLQVGQPHQDKHPIPLGPAEMQLQWRRSWRWTPSYCTDLLPQGLRGGPMLSIAFPVLPLARFMSFEARFSMLEYSYARRGTQRIPLDELADPRRDVYGMEAGVFVNLLQAFMRPERRHAR